MSSANTSKSDDRGSDRAKIDMSPEAISERFGKVWQLTIDEWAAKGVDITNLPMRKDVERLIRLKDK